MYHVTENDLVRDIVNNLTIVWKEHASGSNTDDKWLSFLLIVHEAIEEKLWELHNKDFN